MTEPEFSTQQNVQHAYMDDEIDLRQYIIVLLQWWREILIISFGVAILAGVAVLALRLLPASYVASSEVAIVRVQSDVNFDARFTTTSDEQVGASNATARRSALLGFASSGAIAQKVIDRVGDKLGKDELVAADLLEKADIAPTVAGANRTTDSDLIRITISADTPANAALLATTWAEVFVQEANLVYGQTPTDLVVSMNQALQDSQTTYDKAQQTLTTFLSTSPGDELSRQIQQKEQVLKGLLAGQQTALETALTQVLNAKTRVANTYLQAQSAAETLNYEASQEAQQELLRTYIAARYQSQLDVFRQQVLRDQQMLSTFYNISIRLQKTLASANSLKQQIEASGETVDGGTVAALNLLKIQTFSDILEDATPDANQSVLPSLFQRQSILLPDGQNPASIASARPIQVQMQNTPLQLQINAQQSMDKSAAISEVTALVKAIESQLAELDKSTTTLSNKLLSGDSYAFMQNGVPEDSQLVTTISEQEQQLRNESFQANSGFGLSMTTPLSQSVSGLDLFPDLQVTEVDQIAKQYSSFDPASSQVINQLEVDLRRLKSDLEINQSRQRELAQARDIAWTTLTTVNNKVAELQVSQAAGSSEVRLAAKAVEPSRPVRGTRLSLAVIGGGAVGMMLAILYALIASFVGTLPFLSRPTTTQKANT